MPLDGLEIKCTGPLHIYELLLGARLSFSSTVAAGLLAEPKSKSANL